MDGYFPWELKDDYPDGVPLRVEMHLDVHHGPHDLCHVPFVAFQGAGHVLSAAAPPPAAAQGGAGRGGGSFGREVWRPPGGGSDGAGLFRRLPEAVIRNGEVVPIKV